jgi:1,4-alpha-glucan branching enzyme
MEHEGKEGAHFAVWAPDARKVYVMGDFNGWDKASQRTCPGTRSTFAAWRPRLFRLMATPIL